MSQQIANLSYSGGETKKAPFANAKGAFTN
jgi:hypothetical protein